MTDLERYFLRSKKYFCTRDSTNLMMATGIIADMLMTVEMVKSFMDAWTPAIQEKLMFADTGANAAADSDSNNGGGCCGGDDDGGDQSNNNNNGGSA